MARPLRLEFPGSLHHVFDRGNNKNPTFLDDRDRRKFLELLGCAVEKFGWIVTDYALMTNHYHFVVQLTERSLARGMKWLNQCYTQWFNAAHDRVGHIFQGRYKSPLVEKESYSLELLRYVVLNPVEANIVARPEDYEWSSHRAVLGLTSAPAWLAVDDTLIQFAPNRDTARALYQQFVNDGIGRWSPIEDVIDRPYIGSESWREKIRKEIDLKPRSREHPFIEREINLPGMDRILAAVAEVTNTSIAMIRNGRGGAERSVAAWLGSYEGKLFNSEIGEALRLRSASQVSQLVAKVDASRRDDVSLRQLLDRCVSTLRGETEN